MRTSATVLHMQVCSSMVYKLIFRMPVFTSSSAIMLDGSLMAGIMATMDMCRGSASSSSSPLTSAALMLPSALRLARIRRCTPCTGPAPLSDPLPSGAEVASCPASPA